MLTYMVWYLLMMNTFRVTNPHGYTRWSSRQRTLFANSTYLILEDIIDCIDSPDIRIDQCCDTWHGDPTSEGLVLINNDVIDRIHIYSYIHHYEIMTRIDTEVPYGEPDRNDDDVTYTYLNVMLYDPYTLSRKKHIFRCEDPDVVNSICMYILSNIPRIKL